MFLFKCNIIKKLLAPTIFFFYFFRKCQVFCSPLEVFVQFFVYFIYECNCIFLPHNGGVPLSAFPKSTTIELVDFVFRLSFMLSAKKETVITDFLKSLVQPDLESNSRCTASIKSANLRSLELWVMKWYKSLKKFRIER